MAHNGPNFGNWLLAAILHPVNVIKKTKIMGSGNHRQLDWQKSEHQILWDVL